MNQKQNSQFLETEKLSKLMVKFSVPCVLSLLVSALYNIVDQIFIGNSELSALGNAATGVVFPIFIIAQAFALDKKFISDINANAPVTLHSLYLSTGVIQQAIAAQDKVIRKIANNGSCGIMRMWFVRGESLLLQKHFFPQLGRSAQLRAAAGQLGRLGGKRRNHLRLYPRKNKITRKQRRTFVCGAVFNRCSSPNAFGKIFRGSFSAYSPYAS